MRPYAVPSPNTLPEKFLCRRASFPAQTDCSAGFFLYQGIEALVGCEGAHSSLTENSGRCLLRYLLYLVNLRASREVRHTMAVTIFRYVLASSVTTRQFKLFSRAKLGSLFLTEPSRDPDFPNRFFHAIKRMGTDTPIVFETSATG